MIKIDWENSFIMDRSIINWSTGNSFPQIKAFTTLRHTFDGEAKPRFTGTPEHAAEANREMLAQILDLNAGQLVFPRQTHTRSVALISDMPPDELRDTDGIITNIRGICLCGQTADCVPLLFYDPVKHVVAAVHAGWRGTVGLIAKEAVQLFKFHFSSSSRDLRVIIGPSIGPEKYEVGKEVVEEVRKTIPFPEMSLKKLSSGKHRFNLWEANRQILLECGVLNRNIEITGYCTYSENDSFFSARREGIDTGRLVSGIMLVN